MHFMLFLDWSSHASKCFSVFATQSKTAAINITIIIFILFFTSCQVGVLGAPPSLAYTEELYIVEEFKRKILQHMALTSPPIVEKEFQNTTKIRETYRTEIQDFLQRMQLDEGDSQHSNTDDGGDSGDSLNVLTLRLKSFDKSLRVPIATDNADSSTRSTVFHFTAPSLDLEPPYTKLVLQSAILRIRIKYRKYRLNRDFSPSKSQINITLSVRNNHGSLTNSTPSYTLIKPFLLNPAKMSKSAAVIEINNIKDHLPPMLPFDFSSDKTVFEVTATEIRNHEQKDSSPPRKRNPIKNKHDLSKSNSGSYIKIVPTLEAKVMLVDTRKRRSRRSSDSRCRRSSLCCRHSMYINFADIGWDSWVLSPEGYTAYFCKGGCPTRYKPASIFSGIKGLLHDKNPDAIPAPGCAARGYSSITLLHLGENNRLVETSYPEMSVTGCKCY